MEYINYQPTPVVSSDGQPLMPCHPARARKLLAKGRAVPHHVRGIFGIRLLHRTRAESTIQAAAINIDPGSDTTGIALVADNNNDQRTVLAAYELRHRAKDIKATLQGRASNRRNRRGRMRYRAPRFNNRRKPMGWLAPSIRSLKDDTMRLANTLLKLYPIFRISIERNKFDPQLMMNPDTRGVEYQHGTLHGRQVRAYIMDRDNSRCVYCGKTNVKLELDHVVPRATGSNRADNLVACCRDCNIEKANHPITEFLSDQPDLLKRILERLQRSDLAAAAHVNQALPYLVDDLRNTSLPVELTDAASVSWAREQLGIPKTHCYDAVLQGRNFTSIKALPTQVIRVKPSNGRSKQKANVDRAGTPVGKPFRQQQRQPKNQRRHNPAAGHSDRHQRYGTQRIGTGDTVRFTTWDGETLTGRGTIKAARARIAIRRSGKEVSVNIEKCQRMASNPRWRLERRAPSQQRHAPRQDQAKPIAASETI